MPIEPRFLQIHTLVSYPPSLLNRDDAGFAKRITFGSQPRTRVSSQCLKRHWRVFEGDESIRSIPHGDGTVPMSVRSRRTFDVHVRIPLETEDKVSPEIAQAVTEAIMVKLLGESAKAKKAKEEAKEDSNATKTKKAKESKESKESKDEKPAAREASETGQVTVLGRPELEFLRAEARAIARELSDAKEAKGAVDKRFTAERLENLRKVGAGLDAALFGRMVTSDVLARCDAAVHVAHSFTVHSESAETDYFAAVDELAGQGDDARLGSGHIGTTELTTGLFYGYVVVDVPLLVSNITGYDRASWQKAERDLPAEVVRRLVHLIAKVSPGAKLGSTAPYAYASLVLVEAGTSQPRSLANAFLRPVPGGGGLHAATDSVLAEHIAELDAMYDKSTERRFAALGASKLESVATRVKSLGDIAGWAGELVRGGAR